MKHQLKNIDEIHSFRGALGQFPTGVAVVTALTENLEPVGMTINSFNSVSLAPALVSWCIDHKAASHSSFASAKNFAITLLSEGQSEIAKRFATRGANKFQGVETEPRDAPIIPNGCAWFKCETSHSISLGDHTMLVGRVIDFAKNPVQPLVFKGGQFLQLAEVATRAAA